MSIVSLFSNPRLNQYINDNSVKLDKTAQELFDKAANDELSHMLSSPNQLQLISLFIKMINAKNVLEIGVFRGFSTLIMAQALPSEGKLEACDISYEYYQAIQTLLARSKR